VNDEVVLGFPATLLDDLGRFHGFSAQADRYLPAIRNRLAVRPRSQCETDPTFKQLIPYIVFRSGDGIFSYVRGKRGSEQRLHELESIGVGGHIRAADVSLFADTYRVGMLRELAEEVDLDPATGAERVIGMLNDDTTEVGSVHFGVVHLWDLPRPELRRREGHLLRAGFQPLAALAARRERFESWSQFTLDWLCSSAG
jgi:predicted NUDIX family phosphoesterase